MAVPSITDALFAPIEESHPSNCSFTSLSLILESLGVPELWDGWNVREIGRMGNRIAIHGARFVVYPVQDRNGSVAVFHGIHRVGMIWPRREGFTHSRNSNEELDFPTITESIENLIAHELNRGVFDKVIDRFEGFTRLETEEMK